MKSARLALFFFALIAIASTASGAENIVGRASVIDGDTIEIHGTRIRLHGIDAPESDQICLVNGKQSPCGQQAAKALADYIGRLTVTCEPRDRALCPPARYHPPPNVVHLRFVR